MLLNTRAFVITEPGEGCLQDFVLPELSEGQVLVKVQACGICTTDRRIFGGKLKVAYPVIGGHEVSGEVVGVGSDVLGIVENMRVALDTINRCGTCFYCVKGMDNLCLQSRTGAKLGNAYLIAGGFSEYIIVKRSQVFALSDDTDFSHAALSEPLSCCIHSVKKARLNLGDTVLVVGAGTMGILHAMVARISGANVIISDTDSDRRSLAESLGFSAISPLDISDVHQSVNFGLGFDSIFITAPVIALINDSLSLIRKNGTIVIYTSLHPSGTISFDSNKLHYSEAVITGTEGRTKEDFREATVLISRSQVDLTPLITNRVTLDGLSEELSIIPSGNNQRTIVTF
jgi:L-iditol 2-dehydrogenase